MLKKTVLALIAAGLSSVALANGDVAPAAPAASGFNQGIYVGIQGGWADSGLKAKDDSAEPDSYDVYYDGQPYQLPAYDTYSVSKATGIAGRIFAGFDINQYFAVEAGYMLLGQKADVNATQYDANINVVVGTNSATVRTQAFDLVAKLRAPIFDNFGLYAKAGPGYLMQKWSFSDNGTGTGANSGGTTNADKFDIVYGLGAYYNITPDWTADLSWTRYNSGKTKIADNKWQSNVDFYAIGISYKFELPA